MDFGMLSENVILPSIEMVRNGKTRK